MATKDGDYIAGALNLGSAPTRSMAATGAAPASIRSWDSRRPATTGRSTTPSPTSSNASKPARRARTRSRSAAYLPVATWSAHWIADPRLKTAIDPRRDARAAVSRANGLR